MNYSYINLKHQQNLIEGVVLRKLILNKDSSGSLVETLRIDWPDVYNRTNLKFAMQYLSVTPPGLARDETMWHAHKYQKDRFICISGRIVTAIFDNRQNSKTNGRLNLYLMGPEDENEMYMVIIPEETYHGFLVISETPGFLLNYPTELYNPDDEGRIANKELDWSKVRIDMGIK